MLQTENKGFTSSLETKERIAVLAYFPMHVLILPLLAGVLMGKELMSEVTGNIFVYASGMIYMFAVAFAFFRRDFDPLCDNIPGVIKTVAGSYIWMMVSNYGVNDIILFTQSTINGNTQRFTSVQISALLLVLLPFLQAQIKALMSKAREKNRLLGAVMSISGMVIIVLSIETCAMDIIERSTTSVLSNPNSTAVVDFAGMSFGPVAGMTIFMAPIVEELIFRAGIFGTIMKKSRVAAYVVTILAFSLYHMWGYISDDMINIVYLLQYIPISFLLCRCYEKTNTIWASIFLHMLVNGVSMMIINALGSLV